MCPALWNIFPWKPLVNCSQYQMVLSAIYMRHFQPLFYNLFAVANPYLNNFFSWDHIKMQRLANGVLCYLYATLLAIIVATAMLFSLTLLHTNQWHAHVFFLVSLFWCLANEIPTTHTRLDSHLLFCHGVFCFNFVRQVDWLSFTRQLSKIWLQVRGKNPNLGFFQTSIYIYILVTCKTLWSKCSLFNFFSPGNMATLGHFILKKTFVKVIAPLFLLVAKWANIATKKDPDQIGIFKL